MVLTENTAACRAACLHAGVKLATAFVCMALGSNAVAQQSMSSEVTLLAAGSLQAAMKDIGQLFRKKTGIGVVASFGPSGNLRGDIEKGRQFDVFASAAAEHTGALHAAGLLSGSTVFAHNDLCVASRTGLGLTEANLLDTLKKPDVRVATSTPVSDPMGDYTWQFFRKADQASPGSYDTLDRKALKLSGTGTPAPGAKPPYVAAFDDDKADAYIMYCTNAVATRDRVPGLAVVRIPDALNVRSAYGIGASPSSLNGGRFVEFVLSPEATEILRQYGFN